MNVEPCMTADIAPIIHSVMPDSEVPAMVTDQNTCAVVIYDDDHEVVGIAGVTRQVGSIGTVWTAFTEKVRGHALTVTRRVKAALEDQMAVLCVHRVQMVVHCGDVEVQRWATLLGFHPESIMFHYEGLDLHSFLYVKFSEDIPCPQQPQ